MEKPPRTQAQAQTIVILVFGTLISMCSIAQYEDSASMRACNCSGEEAIKHMSIDQLPQPHVLYLYASSRSRSLQVVMQAINEQASSLPAACPG